MSALSFQIGGDVRDWKLDSVYGVTCISKGSQK